MMNLEVIIIVLRSTLKELSSLKMHNGDDWHASIKTLKDASGRNYPK
jgi:hypothetical protein